MKNLKNPLKWRFQYISPRNYGLSWNSINLENYHIWYIRIALFCFIQTPPCHMPPAFSIGSSIRLSLWKPTTSATIRLPLRRCISQSSPSPSGGPADSTVSPETRTTEPWQSSRFTCFNAACRLSKLITQLFKTHPVLINLSRQGPD